jgi:endonuclease/exonuclease/phosphatase family metal-dependent hydrolase
MAKILKYGAIILLIPVAVFALLIAYATISDFRPLEKEPVVGAVNVNPEIHDSSSLSLLIWNIGYGGLDKDMDFFYDGGKQVRTSKKQFNSNVEGILEFLSHSDSSDIVLLQEVDVKSRRSYGFNQAQSLEESMNNFEAFFAANYDVFFVPVPVSNPMGSVHSGLLSLTRLQPSSVERYAFPGRYKWPKQLFMLDRCFLVMHIPLSGGKELLVVNTHNEAYDDGSIRDQQMAYLKSFLLNAYDRGNYVIVGGDWNQCPPEFKPEFTGEVFDSINNKGIGVDYLPDGWQWIYDPSSPTNRRVDIPYERGTTMTTLIDFYLLSPNIRPEEVKTIDLGFEHSDHQPVKIRITLQ